MGNPLSPFITMKTIFPRVWIRYVDYIFAAVQNKAFNKNKTNFKIF